MKKLMLIIVAVACTSITSAQNNTYNVTNKAVFTKTGSGTITNFKVYMPIPQTNEYQTINNVTLSDGEAVVDNNYDNKFLYVEKNNLPSNPWEVTSTFNITPKTVNIDFSQITEIKEYDQNSTAYKRHLGNRGEYINTSNSTIMQIGDQLWNESSNVLEYARKCYEYVATHYNYIRGSWRTLAQILQAGGGECGDFSTLVVNLLRYKNIPSRHNICLRLDTDNSYHVWVDFYLEDYGWIPLDATYKHDFPNGDYFGRYAGDCIVVAQDMFYDVNGFNLEICQTYSYYYWCNGTVNISDSHKVKNNGPTSIHPIPLSETDNAPRYNLQGQKVDANYKGVIISKGKKHIIR